MNDNECVAFLQWALPRNRMKWTGFRKVRRQVCKRIARRLDALELPDLAAYRKYLNANGEEWATLDRLCRISISRFCRDKGVFNDLVEPVLPALAGGVVKAGRHALQAWSAGCASGEEPYTLVLAWAFAVQQAFPGLKLEVTATDSDDHLIQRARAACYPASSVKEMPEAWRDTAFQYSDGIYRLNPAYTESVSFMEQDLRRAIPSDRFDLVLCRNVAFTYFEPALQREVLSGLQAALRPSGVLVIGAHETLPESHRTFTPWPETTGIYRKVSDYD